MMNSSCTGPVCSTRAAQTQAPSFASPGAFQCPVCGYLGPSWQPGFAAGPGWEGWAPAPGPWSTYPGPYPGLGGLRTEGGSYSPEYIATGLPTDEEIEEMIYDALDLDPLVPYDADIDVDVDAGAVTLTGSVPNKQVKHAVGDDAWWAPGVTDVVNNLTVTGRRRVRNAPRE